MDPYLRLSPFEYSTSSSNDADKDSQVSLNRSSQQLTTLAIKTLPSTLINEEEANRHPRFSQSNLISSIAINIKNLFLLSSRDSTIKASTTTHQSSEVAALWKELGNKTKDVVFLSLEDHAKLKKGMLIGTSPDLLQEKIASLSYENPSIDQYKFRTKDIHPSHETLVKVEDSYLHANYVGNGLIDRLFIASQAPVAHDFAYFWRVVFENTDLILDLTSDNDKLKSNDLDACYPNEKDIELKRGGIGVQLIKEEKFEISTVYTYLVKKNDQERLIKRFHFHKWPDHGVIQIEILNQLVNLLRRSKKPLIALVHCVAGVGRTGTVIIAAILKELIIKKMIHKQNLGSKLLEITVKIREQRDKHVLTKREQFELLLNYGTWLLENRSTYIKF